LNVNPLTLPIAIVLVAILVVALSIRRLRTLQRTPHAKWRRITERVLLSLVILLCVIAAGSTIFNAAALRYYRSIYPAPGTIYRVNGHDMHIYCTGEGSPTIVLEAGLGDDSLKWGKVQPELSNFQKLREFARMTAPDSAGALRGPIPETPMLLPVNYMLYCSKPVFVAPSS